MKLPPDSIEIVSASGKQVIRAFGANASQLGKGGAGRVYAHPDAPRQALKIYGSEQRASTHEGKVKAMLDAVPGQTRTRAGVVQIAWPTAYVVVDGRFAGFSMPRIDFSQAWTMQQLAQPSQRTRKNIPERLELRLVAARNLVTVLESLHAIGHFVVDLKPQNILVYKDTAGRSAANIALVDCDGFQIRGRDGSRHDAELATAEYLHPSLSTNTRAGDVSFDVKILNQKALLQDDFALAIILFELFNNGLHPMSGVEVGLGTIPSDKASRLRQASRFYPYGAASPNPYLNPDPDSIHHWYDAELRALFDQAFLGKTPPPAAAAWASVLQKLSDEQHRCHIHADHWALGPTCGLCALTGAPPPPPAQRTQIALTSRPPSSVPISASAHLPAPAVPTPARSMKGKTAAAIAAAFVVIFLCSKFFSGDSPKPTSQNEAAPQTLALDTKPSPPQPTSEKADNNARPVAVVAQAHDPDIFGKWSGTYVCQQGITHLALQVTPTSGDGVEAQFHFGPTSVNPNVPDGCFKMAGAYNKEAHHLTLFAEGWVNRPAGFTAVNIEGDVASDGQSISGRVIGAGCTSLALGRVSQSWDTQPDFCPATSAGPPSNQPAESSAQITQSALVQRYPAAPAATQDNSYNASQFALDYFHQWSGSAVDAMSLVGRAYAEQVTMYGKPMTREKVQIAKDNFVERWPLRRYTVRPSSVRSVCDVDRCHVAGIVDWEAESPARSAKSVGSAEFAFDISLAGDKPLIVAETGHVLSRGQ